MAAAVLRLQPTHEAHGCAVVALATYLGRSYEDVIRAATLVDKCNHGTQGLTTPEIKRVAASFGVTLTKTKAWDHEHDRGLAVFPDHLALVWNGLLFDVDHTIWAFEDFCAAQGYEQAKVWLLRDPEDAHEQRSGRHQYADLRDGRDARRKRPQA